jgi:hypothetical protein
LYNIVSVLLNIPPNTLSVKFNIPPNICYVYSAKYSS